MLLMLACCAAMCFAGDISTIPRIVPFHVVLRDTSSKEVLVDDNNVPPDVSDGILGRRYQGATGKKITDIVNTLAVPISSRHGDARFLPMMARARICPSRRRSYCRYARILDPRRRSSLSVSKRRSRPSKL